MGSKLLQDLQTGVPEISRATLEPLRTEQVRNSNNGLTERT